MYKINYFYIDLSKLLDFLCVPDFGAVRYMILYYLYACLSVYTCMNGDWSMFQQPQALKTSCDLQAWLRVQRVIGSGKSIRGIGTQMCK